LGDRRIVPHEMLGQRETERFDIPVEVVLRQRVHGVLHRVGRKDRGVVSIRVRPREISFEPHGDGHIPEVVTVARPTLISRMDFP
jgi:hypothetical protein